MSVYDPLCGCHCHILNMIMPGVLVTCLKQNHHVFSLNKLRRSYAAHPDAHLSWSSLLHVYEFLSQDRNNSRKPPASCVRSLRKAWGPTPLQAASVHWLLTNLGKECLYLERDRLTMKNKHYVTSLKYSGASHATILETAISQPGVAFRCETLLPQNSRDSYLV